MPDGGIAVRGDGVRRLHYYRIPVFNAGTELIRTFGRTRVNHLVVRVYEDPNRNGLFLPAHGDADGLPAENQTVSLHTDPAGPAIRTGQTDADGVYRFEHIPAGQVYYVRQQLPAGAVQSRPLLICGNDYYRIPMRQQGITYRRYFGFMPTAN